jgi:hypothetical protein
MAWRSLASEQTVCLHSLQGGGYGSIVFSKCIDDKISQAKKAKRSRKNSVPAQERKAHIFDGQLRPDETGCGKSAASHGKLHGMPGQAGQARGNRPSLRRQLCLRG